MRNSNAQSFAGQSQRYVGEGFIARVRVFSIPPPTYGAESTGNQLSHLQPIRMRPICLPFRIPGPLISLRNVRN